MSVDIALYVSKATSGTDGVNVGKLDISESGVHRRQIPTSKVDPST